MSMLPFMPLFVDDYEAATAHLSLLEDGAYSRLLRLCWRSPGCKLPQDDEWIFRKVRAKSDEEKQAVRSVLGEFFTTGRGKVWSKRLLSIHLQKSVTYQNKKEAAEKARAAKALKNINNTDTKTEAKQSCLPSQPEPEPEPDKDSYDDDDAREAFFPILKSAVGWSKDPTEKDRVTVDKWLSGGLTQAEILGVISEVLARKAGARAPSSLGYFSQSMADLIAAKADDKLPPAEGRVRRLSFGPDMDTVFKLAATRRATT